MAEETTGVRIPKSLMRRLKIRAAEDDTSASAIATFAIEDYLSGNELSKAEREAERLEVTAHGSY